MLPVSIGTAPSFPRARLKSNRMTSGSMNGVSQGAAKTYVDFMACSPERNPTRGLWLLLSSKTIRTVRCRMPTALACSAVLTATTISLMIRETLSITCKMRALFPSVLKHLLGNLVLLPPASMTAPNTFALVSDMFMRRSRNDLYTPASLKLSKYGETGSVL